MEKYQLKQTLSELEQQLSNRLKTEFVREYVNKMMRLIRENYTSGLVRNIVSNEESDFYIDYTRALSAEMKSTVIGALTQCGLTETVWYTAENSVRMPFLVPLEQTLDYDALARIAQKTEQSAGVSSPAFIPGGLGVGAILIGSLAPMPVVAKVAVIAAGAGGVIYSGYRVYSSSKTTPSQRDGSNNVKEAEEFCLPVVKRNAAENAAQLIRWMSEVITGVQREAEGY